jgi:phage shock protein A
MILQQEETKYLISLKTKLTEKEDMVMYLLYTKEILEKQNSNLQKENQKFEQMNKDSIKKMQALNSNIGDLQAQISKMEEVISKNWLK